MQTRNKTHKISEIRNKNQDNQKKKRKTIVKTKNQKQSRTKYENGRKVDISMTNDFKS